jgi:aldose sugar dehydrogenase
MFHLDSMHFRTIVSSVSILLAGCLGSSGSTDSPPESDPAVGPDYSVEVVVAGLQNPWGMSFLPGADDMALVTERLGRLNLVDLKTGAVSEVTGLPAIAAVGQGGLLDVALYPDYGLGREWVYLTYSASHPDNTGQYVTHVGRGRLNGQTLTQEDFELLYVGTPYSSGTRHFGSRMAFDDQWRLYVTMGDRGDRHAAQDLSSHWGKILRLERDGTVPADNPFVGEPDAEPAIYTYGHRNPQGLAVEPATGRLWENEHGEQNGDEINIIDQPGGNYGWPIATYANEYGSGGEPIGILPSESADTVHPVHYWDGTEYDDGQDGFPPSGMAFYTNDAFPQWQGNLFMGNLAHRYLGRFTVQGNEVIHEERMLRDRNWRVRDVRVHPQRGHIYLLVDAADAPLVRIRPVED